MAVDLGKRRAIDVEVVPRAEEDGAASAWARVAIAFGLVRASGGDYDAF